jgi:hypothetical protein
VVDRIPYIVRLADTLITMIDKEIGDIEGIGHVDAINAARKR